MNTYSVKTDKQKLDEGIHPMSLIRNAVLQYRYDCMWFLGEEATEEGIYQAALEAAQRNNLGTQAASEYKPK